MPKSEHIRISDFELRLTSPSRAGATAFASTLARRTLVHGSTAAGTALLASPGHFVDRRPGAPLRFLLAGAAMLVPFFDMFGLTFLFAAITALSPRGIFCY